MLHPVKDPWRILQCIVLPLEQYVLILSSPRAGSYGVRHIWTDGLPRNCHVSQTSISTTHAVTISYERANFIGKVMEDDHSKYIYI